MGKLLDNLRKKQVTEPSKTNRHTLNFLAHKDDIAEAMREGWTTKQIWEQMIEDGLTTMSYATLCRLIKKHIMPSMDNAHGALLPASASPLPSAPPIKTRANTSTKQINRSDRKLTEKERLDLMKKEAFASVRSVKKTEPLIGPSKPRSRRLRDGLS